MRIGVLRGDLPGPIFLADLEPVSQRDPIVEASGQMTYLSRPTAAKVAAALANANTGAGATVEGSALTFPITIDGTNDTLRVKISAAASFTARTIARAAYASLTTLVAAVTAALAGTGIVARAGVTANTLALESPHGVNSYLAVDSAGHSSTANATLGISTSGVVRTMPTAAEFILALNPVDDTLNVSDAAISAVDGADGTSANAMSLIPASRGAHTALADVIAPRFADTPIAIDSYLVGHISEFRSASFTPDRKRLSAKSAISVVGDDGTTAYPTAVPEAKVPSISSAVISAGTVTITGTGLGHIERDEDTFVHFSGALVRTLSQKAIERAGGSVTSTSIVIPAKLLYAVGTTTVQAAASTTWVRVRVRGLVSSYETDASGRSVGHGTVLTT